MVLQPNAVLPPRKCKHLIQIFPRSDWCKFYLTLLYFFLCLSITQRSGTERSGHSCHQAKSFRLGPEIFLTTASLRGDGVNKKCAPRLFRSINLCIPVLKNKEDLYQCLSHVGWGRDKMAGHFGLNAPAEDSLKQCLEEIGSVENIGGNKTNVLHVLMAFLEGWLKLNRPGHADKSNPGTVQGKKDYTLELMMLAFVDENPK